MKDQFIQLLFHHRRVFHSIALRHTAKGSSFIAVCWVDILLAKLAEAVVVVAGAHMTAEYAQNDLPLTIRRQREEDNVRAAAQLPGT